MLPTFARLTGAALDATRIIDGVDAAPLLFDTEPKTVRDTHLYYGAGASPLVAIRQGDWKYFLPTNPTKADLPAGQPGALFNLREDLGETTDVAAQHPDLVVRLSSEALRRHAEMMTNKRPSGKSSGPGK
jgi:arylsulfatase A